ncbi:MAG: DUF488 domain-containing protein [Desulfobacteraceae bacterium]|nr:DUF488 domain-containing protein [Desulfobacteraceae bacterium]
MTIYTIGYEGLNEKIFMACLKRFKISFLADVRERPLSRKKGFSKTAMMEMLESENIQYKNFRELGSSKEMRDDLHKNKNYSSFFSTYKKMIGTQQNQIDELLEIIHQGHNVALLCFEKDADKCHRKIVAEEIKKRDGNGMVIRHIQSLL